MNPLSSFGHRNVAVGSDCGAENLSNPSNKTRHLCDSEVFKEKSFEKNRYRQLESMTKILNASITEGRSISLVPEFIDHYSDQGVVKDTSSRMCVQFSIFLLGHKRQEVYYPSSKFHLNRQTAGLMTTFDI